MVALLFCSDTIAAVFKGITTQTLLSSVLLLIRWLVLATKFSKLEVSSFTTSKYMTEPDVLPLSYTINYSSLHRPTTIHKSVISVIACR